MANFPEFGTFDLGRAYSQAENVRGMQQERALRDVQMEGAKLALEKARQPDPFTPEQLKSNTEMLYAAGVAISQDPSAAAYWVPELKRAGIVDPNLDTARLTPEQLQEAGRKIVANIGPALEALKPAKDIGTLYATGPEGTLLPASEAKGKTKYQEPRQPAQGPTGSWSAPFQAVGADGKPGLFTQHSISGAVRPVSAAGGAGLAPLPKGDAPGAGLNDRQRGGLNMVRDNMLAFAAARSGKSRAEVDAIYAVGGAGAIGDLIRKSPDRNLEGANARFLQAFPLGEAIVDAANVDLVAARKGGGAGMASYQNPTGMIATADFTVGEAQVPGPVYPKETQAQIIEQRLRETEMGLGEPKQQRTTPENRVPRREAPPAAIEYLKKNPGTKAAFFEKYGYLP